MVFNVQLEAEKARTRLLALEADLEKTTHVSDICG